MGISKKMKSIIASLAMLAILGASLGGATFAWFTIGTEATATGFDFTASTAEGIQVSTDAETWMSNLSVDDFDVESGPQEGNRINLEDIQPVSTTNNLTDGELEFFNAEYASDNFTITESTEDFLQFDLYFNNPGSEELNLMLDLGSSITGDDRNTHLSTRMAFVNQGTSSDSSEVVGLSEGNDAYFWEPNSLDRDDSAMQRPGTVNSAKYEYHGLTGDNDGAEIGSEGTDSHGYLEPDDYTELVDYTHDQAIGDSNIITTLAGSTMTKVTVYAWMEGQDVDNSNATSGGNVQIDLMFDSADAEVGVADVESITLDEAATSSTELVLEEAAPEGYTYKAFILQDGETSQTNLSYKALIEDMDLESGLDTFEFEEELAAGEYTVVLFGHSTSSSTFRSETTITIE